MALKTGTLDIASLQAATNTSAIEFGEDNIAQILAADNRAYSDVVEDALSDLVETTTDRMLLVGNSLGGNAVEVDEYGQSPTQKDAPGYFIGIPLRKLQFAIGWTRQWLKRAKAADLAARNSIAQGAMLRRIRYELQRAIYGPTNTTFTDHLTDKAALPVKAFINADSTAMANGPNGETFDGATHTHYDGIASLTADAFRALINDVAEHRNGAKVRVYINYADVATVAALTGFVALQQPHLILAADTTTANSRIDNTKLDNRQVGWFDGAEVWTKPWAVANYAVAADIEAPVKPLARRVEENDLGLHIAASIESHPLEAEFSEWFTGFAPRNRTALAVLRFNNGTYAAPTLSY